MLTFKIHKQHLLLFLYYFKLVPLNTRLFILDYYTINFSYSIFLKIKTTLMNTKNTHPTHFLLIIYVGHTTDSVTTQLYCPERNFSAFFEVFNNQKLKKDGNAIDFVKFST